MTIIITAVKEELSKKNLPNFHITYTAISKINAAIYKNILPSLIINFSTAGSSNKDQRFSDSYLLFPKKYGCYTIDH